MQFIPQRLTKKMKLALEKRSHCKRASLQIEDGVAQVESSRNRGARLLGLKMEFWRYQQDLQLRLYGSSEERYLSIFSNGANRETTKPSCRDIVGVVLKLKSIPEKLV